MATPLTVITIDNALIFDPNLLMEDGRYVITNSGPQTIKSDAFENGIAEIPVLLVSNSILAIQQIGGTAMVDMENLPDNLEFLYQNGSVLYFVIKGDCDIPLIPV